MAGCPRDRAREGVESFLPYVMSQTPRSRHDPQHDPIERVMSNQRRERQLCGDDQDDEEDYQDDLPRSRYRLTARSDALLHRRTWMRCQPPPPCGSRIVATTRAATTSRKTIVIQKSRDRHHRG